MFCLFYFTTSQCEKKVLRLYLEPVAQRCSLKKVFCKEKIALSNPKTNPEPNPNRNRGAISIVGNFLVAPNPKTNPHLDPNPNPNQGQFSLGGNCPNTNIKWHFLEIKTMKFS